MKNTIHKKVTKEDKFSRNYACWAQNHRSGAWRREKVRTRRLFRRNFKKDMRGESDETD